MIINTNNSLKLAFVGGFGHANNVFNEFLNLSKEKINCVGYSAAYEEENLDCFTKHSWIENSKAPYFQTVEQLLSTTRPDILVISTRPDYIPKIALKGLEAGCHLIIEKPLALDSKILRELYDKAKSARLSVMGMLSMRSAYAFIKAKEVISSGEIGKVLLINTRKSYKWGNRPEWFNDRQKYGGTWPWIGIHNLDMTHFITGLCATHVIATHQNKSHPDFPYCEDTASALFTLEGDVQMVASIDLCRPESAPTWGDDWIRVVGSKGVLEANGSAGKVTLINSKGSSEFSFPIDDFKPIYKPFIESLREKKELDPTPFYLTAAVLAARESADKGCQIKVDLNW